MKDLTGNKYGKWAVLEFSHKDKWQQAYWKCACECGRAYVVAAASLENNRSLSCSSCAKKGKKSRRKGVNKYIWHDDYVECICKNGKSFTIDTADYELVSKYLWGVSESGYARNAEKGYLHALILNSNAFQIVDHIDHDKLNNRRSNLRLCDSHANAWNSVRPKNNKSGYKGVHRHTRTGKWISQIRCKDKRYHLGCFDNIYDAAKAYNDAAVKLFGEYACLNNLL